MEILAFIAFLAFSVLAVLLIASLFVKKLRKKYLLVGLVASFVLFMVGVLTGDFTTEEAKPPVVAENSGDTTKNAEEVKAEEVVAAPVVATEDEQKVSWEDEVKKIADNVDLSKTQKFDDVSMFARDYAPTEQDIENFEITILNAYSSGEYLADIDNDLYMLSNIFMADVIERSYDDKLIDPMDQFALDFLQNSKYVYRGVDAVDSESVIENERQMDKSSNKM